ncbi:cation diffusion facilitator family transporter [Thiolapillus brandeum]|uniref:Cation diffusion facilitator, CDF family n=1 Tax=Thiolapillus brandeum TaxID=1076588 RepID=A0A7U6GJM3_9GAMM|nr:cation diffusion facilitator family transporter [Thiolapillus brandeum]BAO44911.1 cation diffusion facilitator, CDF family [Thiolapillus brandeum]
MTEHAHTHAVPESGKRLAIVILLNFTITAAEIIGGLISGSLSLLSDALHNFSDGIAVIIAWIAIRLSLRPRSEKHTFGLKRAQVLAAVINAGALIAISIYLFVEAWQRFIEPQAIGGVVMTAVATIGLVANVIGTWLLHRGSKQNMNLKAAYLHLFSDAISSIGVILGGLAITFWNVYWIDPVLTVLIGLYVLKESLMIVWRSLHMFMLAAPDSLSLSEVREAVLGVTGVESIHHIHLWEVAENDIHFEAHIEVPDQPLHDAESIRHAIEKTLHDRFEITHVTLQVEPVGGECSTAALP